MIARIKDWLWRGGWSPLLDIALVAALAISLAYWTWVALTPRAVAAPALASQLDIPASGPIVRRNLFGGAQNGSPAATPDAAPAARLNLTGVVAPGAPGTGRAVFKLENGKPAIANVGEAVMPGVILKEVHPDHVVVARDGAFERITLDRRAATAETQAGARRQPPGRDAGK